MKAWLPWLAVGLPGLVLVLLEVLRRRQAREDAADYVQRIQILKSDAPLALPAVKALKARIVKKPRQKPRQKARPKLRRIS